MPELSVQEYIQQEIGSNTKYEYHDGKIYALAGGTLNHGLISGNVYNELRVHLKKKDSDCLPFNSDVKLFIASTNSYVYPDSMVIGGEIESSEEDNNAVANPVLIVEVLSDSTADYDRGDKFYLYRQIPSFKEYLLIEQKKHVVDVHFKNKNSDLWRITRYEGLDKMIPIHSLGIEISMSDLYYRTKIDV
jgi:Uma2 family endonuclease